MHINFEFKAIHGNVGAVEKILQQHNPEFIGEDRQVDTYFNVPKGRLKLREGNIEHALIFYERTDAAAAKQSNVILYQHKPDVTLKAILSQSLGIKIVVDKKRRIYFIGNVKFHFDEVKHLGSFVEVEAIDKDGSLGLEEIQKQCLHYKELLGIKNSSLIADSYSDLLLAKKSSLP